jgi:hypothetical protein
MGRKKEKKTENEREIAYFEQFIHPVARGTVLCHKPFKFLEDSRILRRCVVSKKQANDVSKVLTVSTISAIASSTSMIISEIFFLRCFQSSTQGRHTKLQI